MPEGKIRFHELTLSLAPSIGVDDLGFSVKQVRDMSRSMGNRWGILLVERSLGSDELRSRLIFLSFAG